MKRVLILGANGYVGFSLARELVKDRHYELYGTYHNVPVTLPGMDALKLDSGSIQEAVRAIEKVRPQSIITCLINRREGFDEQFEFNRNLAFYSGKTGCSIFFCSTANAVVKERSGPYYEDCRPNPDCDYGIYKARCERMYLTQIPQNVCIMRLPQIWGQRSRHFTNLISAVQNGEKLTLYPNLFMNFNTDAMLAKQIHFLLDQAFTGIIHLAADDAVTHKAFLLSVLSGLGYSAPKYEEDPGTQGNMALFSHNAAKFPEELTVSNKDVLDYVIKTGRSQTECSHS